MIASCKLDSMVRGAYYLGKVSSKRRIILITVFPGVTLSYTSNLEG